MTLLRTVKLSRSFGSLIVTNNVNLSIEVGERHVIIGPNGAGKTSFVNSDRRTASSFERSDSSEGC